MNEQVKVMTADYQAGEMNQVRLVRGLGDVFDDERG
jgi:hypothetical protein